MRFFRLIIVALLGLGVFVAQAQSSTCGLPLDDHTVVLYHCDEGSGTIVTDASPNARNGFLEQGAGWGAPYGGTAAVCLASPGDRITFPGGVTGGLSQGTVECAFKWSGTWVDNNPHIIDQFLSPSASNVSLFLRQDPDGQWRLQVGINRQYGASGSTAIQANRWYLAAFTWDGQVSRLYLDGMLEGQTALATIPETTAAPLLFGYNAGGSGGTSQFLGCVDEIRISNVARTSLLNPCPIAASVDLDPHTLNVSSNGLFVTGYIELPLEFDLTAIDISTIRLNGTIPALPKRATVGDHDGDLIPDLMVKFDRAVVSGLPLGLNHVNLTGALTSGETFEGGTSITLINPTASAAKALSINIISAPGQIPVEYAVRSPAVALHTVRVFDAQGRLVRSWREPVIGAARGKWDGIRADGSRAASGVYFIRVESGRLGATRKAVIVR